MKEKKQVRLERLLSNLGYGSRKMVGIMIKLGSFTLDGEAVRDPSALISLDAVRQGRALIEGIPLDPLWPLTILLHKPAGYVCSHDDPMGGADIYELLPFRFHAREPALSVAGRLDKDSTGLVLLTDDGTYLHRVISPKTDVPKRYRVTLDRPLSGDEGAVFASGTLMLKGEVKPLKPAELEILGEKEVIVTLHEGRYHQVRRMFAACGNHVTALHRFAVGGLTLDGLEEGQWRALSADESEQVFGHGG